jgi:hypothetical protein
VVGLIRWWISGGNALLSKPSVSLQLINSTDVDQIFLFSETFDAHQRIVHISLSSPTIDLKPG